MSTLQRIHWLVSEIHSGRNALVTFSYNAQTGREKITFKLDHSYCNSGVYRPCIFGALCAAQAAIQSSISTDKGHTSKSTGCTIVEFWLQQPGFNADKGNAKVPADPTEVDLHTADSQQIDMQEGSRSDAIYEEMEQVAAPPCKRVRFSLQDEVAFIDADNLAPQSLEEFIADVSIAAPIPTTMLGVSKNEWIMHQVIPELESAAAKYFDLAFDELRKTIPSWPPVANQTEQEGVATISAFVLDGFTTMVDENGILSRLSEDRMVVLRDRLMPLIDARLQQMKQALPAS